MTEIFGSLNEAVKELLCSDPQFEKLRTEDFNNIMEKANRNANKAIDFVYKDNSSLDDVIEYIKTTCVINYDERKDVLAYSDIRFPSNEINVYTYLIDKVMAEYKVCTSSKENFINLFILHEFYHYIEENIKLNLETFKVKGKILGLIGRETEFKNLSEMSATIFMRKLVNDIDEYIEREC